MYDFYLNQLKTKCSDIWHNGRQLCEAVSLTGHICVNELHHLATKESSNYQENNLSDTESNDADSDQLNEQNDHESRNKRFQENRHERSDSKRNSLSRFNLDLLKTRTLKTSISKNEENSLPKPYRLPIKSHNSNIITRAASNCGEFQRERKDPFDLKEANFDFYEEFSSMEIIATKNIKKYQFQVDQKNNNSELEKASLGQFISSKNPSESNYSQDNQTESSNLTSSPSNKVKIETKTSDVPSRFTGAMLHSESPPGFLPKFNSWSLVSIGKFSDYNPQLGFI